MLAIYLIFTLIVELIIWLLYRGEIRVAVRNANDAELMGRESYSSFRQAAEDARKSRMTAMLVAPLVVAAFCFFAVVFPGSDF